MFVAEATGDGAGFVPGFALSTYPLVTEWDVEQGGDVWLAESVLELDVRGGWLIWRGGRWRIGAWVC